jgi:hypothetical protein
MGVEGKGYQPTEQDMKSAEERLTPLDRAYSKVRLENDRMNRADQVIRGEKTKEEVGVTPEDVDWAGGGGEALFERELLAEKIDKGELGVNFQKVERVGDMDDSKRAEYAAFDPNSEISHRKLPSQEDKLFMLQTIMKHYNLEPLKSRLRSQYGVNYLDGVRRFEIYEGQESDASLSLPSSIDSVVAILRDGKRVELTKAE